MASRRVVRPGSVARGSSTGRPVMAALDLLGKRWTLRLLWELRDGPLGARAILSRCPGLSSSVLYERLRELTASGLLERAEDDYGLTAIGSSLRAALQPLDEWAHQWAEATTAAER